MEVKRSNACATEVDDQERMERTPVEERDSIRSRIPMATAELNYLRNELERRQKRLKLAVQSPLADRGLSQLLEEVDSALSRIENGTYGLCEKCHDPIEVDRLLADPMVRFCLDDLSGDERRALEQDMALAAKIQRG